MQYSITQLMAIALFTSPLVSALNGVDAAALSAPERRFVGGNANLASLVARHQAALDIVVESREPHHTAS